MKTRVLVIARHEAGRPIAALLQARLRLSRPEVQRLLQAGKVQVAGAPCRDPQRRVHAGQRVELTAKDKRLPVKPARSGPDLRIVFADEQIVVVDKPAGLTTVRHAHEVGEFGKRASRYLPATLVDLLQARLAATGKGGRVRAVHRLDKETSGLVVLARTAQAERHLGKQFRAHSIERRYLAIVRGTAQNARIESYLVPDRGDGRRGSGTKAGAGQRAVTHVQVLERLDRFTLVECTLETGRTHQVRIHLGEQGTPLCGERIYDRPLHGAPVPDRSAARRPALHAASLAIDHPLTGKRLQWTSSLPADMRDLLKRLR